MDNTARELLLQAIDLLDLTYDPHADEGCPAATLTAEILSHLEKAEATPNHKTTPAKIDHTFSADSQFTRMQQLRRGAVEAMVWSTVQNTQDTPEALSCSAQEVVGWYLMRLSGYDGTQGLQEVRDELADAFDLVADEAEDEGHLSPVEIGMASVFSDDDLRVEVRGILRRMAVTA
mgnify:CR=1 FL=1